MKTEKCQRQLCARMVVQSRDKQVEQPAFEVVLKQVFPHFGATLEPSQAEMILDIDSVSVTYNSKEKRRSKLTRWKSTMKLVSHN